MLSLYLKNKGLLGSWAGPLATKSCSLSNDSLESAPCRHSSNMAWNGASSFCRWLVSSSVNPWMPASPGPHMRSCPIRMEVGWLGPHVCYHSMHLWYLVRALKKNSNQSTSCAKFTQKNSHLKKVFHKIINESKLNWWFGVCRNAFMEPLTIICPSKCTNVGAQWGWRGH